MDTDDYIVVAGDRRSIRPTVFSRSLAEILTREERERLKSGEVVAVDEWYGTLLDLDSRLPLGTTVRLRAPDPLRDLQGIGVVNDQGEIVPLVDMAAEGQVDNERRCQVCTAGRKVTAGQAADGRPKYGCTNCSHTYTMGFKGEPWDPRKEPK